MNLQYIYFIIQLLGGKIWSLNVSIKNIKKLQLSYKALGMNSQYPLFLFSFFEKKGKMNFLSNI